jgi:hypothetical protein
MPTLENFSIGTQGKAGNLCWAAVGLGIASYYDRLAGSTARWTQLCEFVVAVFSSHDGTSPESLRCCEGQRILGPDCNQPFDIPDALEVTRNRGSVLKNPLKYEQLKAEIDMKRPIGVEIQSDSGNHFIVVFGYDETNGQKVVVGDPAPDAPTSALLLYDELLRDYRHSGAARVNEFETSGHGI